MRNPCPCVRMFAIVALACGPSKRLSSPDASALVRIEELTLTLPMITGLGIPHQAVVIKGYSRAAAPISQPSPIDVGPRGDRVRWRIRVWPVNGSMIKEELFRWLRLDRPTEESGEPYPTGYCHFPKYSEEYFKQLTAEQLVTRIVKGYRRPEWRKTRDRNEELDVRTYARAAAAVYGMDRFIEISWKTLEDRMEEAEKRVGQPPLPPAPPARRIRGRFF